MVSQTTQGTAAAATQPKESAFKILTGKTQIRDFFESMGIDSGSEIWIDLTMGSKPQKIKLSARPQLNKQLKAIQFQSQPITGPVKRIEHKVGILPNEAFKIIVSTRSASKERTYTVNKEIKKAQ